MKHIASFLTENVSQKFKFVMTNTLFSSKTLLNAFKHSDFFVCADGGANVLYDSEIPHHDLLPDLLIGDFDSLRKDVEEFYFNNGVDLLKVPSEDKTDLEEAFVYLDNNFNNPYIVVIGENGGRFDQEMSMYDVLFKYNQFNPCILSLNNVGRVLQPNIRHEIYLTEAEHRDEGIGLIPLSGRNCVTTKGLEWDIDGDIEFGKFISSSNMMHQDAEFIEVVCEKPVFFTTSLVREYDWKDSEI